MITDERIDPMQLGDNIRIVKLEIVNGEPISTWVNA